MSVPSIVMPSSAAALASDTASGRTGNEIEIDPQAVTVSEASLNSCEMLNGPPVPDNWRYLPRQDRQDHSPKQNLVNLCASNNGYWLKHLSQHTH